MWRKVRGTGKVPHLARWFDFMTELPEMRATLDESMPKRAALNAAGDNNSNDTKNKGGAGACVWVGVCSGGWVARGACRG